MLKANISIGLMILFLTASQSIGQNHDCTDYLDSEISELDVDLAARDFGLAGPYNIGIVMTYGTENGSSPPEIADFLSDLISEAVASSNYVPDHVSFNTMLFLGCSERAGISVSFKMGGLAVGPLDVRDAISEEAISEVVETRASVTRLLFNGFPVVE